MRIGYLNFMIGMATGPSKKISGQSVALDRLGIEGFDVLILNAPEASRSGRLRSIPLPRLPAGSLLRGLGRFRILRHVLDLEPYDLLLLRYPGADPWGLAFLDQYPTVTEHHTKEIPEKSALLSSRLSIPQRVHKLVTLKVEKRFGPPIIRRARGVVGITEDVRSYQVTRAGFHGPSLALPNGVLVESVPLSGFLPFDGRVLQLVVMGSHHSPWVGADRLLTGLMEHRGPVRIVCHFVGEWNALDVPERLTDAVTVRMHGTLHGRALETLLSEVTLGISSLALHRNSMTEGSPLKTREYVARGLPVVTGYSDPDLRHPTAEAFHLALEANDTPLCPDRLIQFAESLGGRSRQAELSTQMRSYASQHMDWVPKMDQLVRFLRAV